MFFLRLYNLATFATTMHYEGDHCKGLLGGKKQVNTCRSPLTSVVKLIPENLRGEWIIKDLQFQLHAITITITWGKPLFLGKTTGGPIRKIRLNMNATIEGEHNIRKWAPIQG